MDKLTEVLEVLEVHQYDPNFYTCYCDSSVELFRSGHRAHLAEMLRPLLVEVWAGGHTTSQVREMDACRCGAWYVGECGCGLYGTGKIITKNPYNEKEPN